MIDEVTCRIMNPKRPEKDLESLFESCYQMWFNVWTESYHYFGWDPSSVYSDQWRRQDFILGLFYQNQPIGCAFFDIKNFQHGNVMADSYFRMWPKDILMDVKSWLHSDRAVVSNNFTLAKGFRKSAYGFDWKAILHAAIMKGFVELNCPFMLGTMVRMSGMNKLSLSHGAQLLREDVDEKGVTVDLVYWRREVLSNFIFPDINGEIQKIWNQSCIGSDLQKAYDPKPEFGKAA